MAFVPILIFWIMKTAVLLLGIRFHLKTAYAFQLKRLKKANDNDLRKSGSYHLKRLRFETVADLGEGSPLSSRSISATARVDIGEGAGLWNWWRLSVTYYRFRCLGGVECICSVNYRKRKKKSMRFQIRANQDGKQKGYVRLNENISILFWRQNEYFWEQSRVSGA